jgi:hypothetical protein
MVAGLLEARGAMKKARTELVHVGKYAAEVSIEIIEDEGDWSPYVSFEDAKKIEAVRLALENGDVSRAAQYARVFELLPISA